MLSNFGALLWSISYIEQGDFDILGFTETWLTDSIADVEIELTGYKIFRKDRVSNVKTQGGGVLWYIKDDINIVLRDDIHNSLFPEAIFCSIISDKEKTLIGLCSRPPDSSLDNHEGLFNILEQASKDNNDCIIIGDLIIENYHGTM